MGIIADNYARVCERVNDAAVKSGRAFEDITIVAVTKTVGLDGIAQAVAAGAKNLGENRVQEYLSKKNCVDGEINWHLIGQIQTNKVKYITSDVKLIHSLDRISLARELDRRAKGDRRVIEALIEVNLSLEDTKAGVLREGLKGLMDEVCSLDGIKVTGFMTMAPYGTDDESARPYFAALRDLMERYKDVRSSNLELKYLSMGMTGDYYGAILEGANIVRIGSAIFKSGS